MSLFLAGFKPTVFSLKNVKKLEDKRESLGFGVFFPSSSSFVTGFSLVYVHVCMFCKYFVKKPNSLPNYFGSGR